MTIPPIADLADARTSGEVARALLAQIDAREASLTSEINRMTAEIGTLGELRAHVAEFITRQEAPDAARAA